MNTHKIEHYHFYNIKDLLGNIRETYVHPEAGYKECIQRMQYYPSGLPWAEAAGALMHMKNNSHLGEYLYGKWRIRKIN
jgi:hypothetical protein